jgi:long-subunit fatty acid transport protein
LGFTQSKDFNLGYQYEGLNAGARSFVQALAEDGDPTARALGLSYSAYDAAGNYLGDRTVLGPNMYEQGYLLDEGALFNLSIGAAVEAAHNVFFGVSANYSTGATISDLELSALDTNDVYPAGMRAGPDNPQTDGFIGTDYRLVRDLQYSGWNVRFGILYKLENFVAWSVSFKLPTSHSIKETLFRSGRSTFASSHSLVVPETESQLFYSFTPPPETTLGAMANFWILTGTAQASYIDYSAMKLNSGVGVLSERTGINKRLKDELVAVINLNAGVEFRPPFTGLSLRAGGMYQPSPFKNAPAGASQKFLTAGLGINSNNLFQVDIGYAYGWRGENKNQQTSSDGGAEQAIAYQSILLTMRFAP